MDSLPSFSTLSVMAVSLAILSCATAGCAMPASKSPSPKLGASTGEVTPMPPAEDLRSAVMESPQDDVAPLPRVVVVLADGRVALVPLDVIKKHRTDKPASGNVAVREDDGAVTLATSGKGAVRIPLALLEEYIDASARPGHGKRSRQRLGAAKGAALSASAAGEGEPGWEDSEATFHTDFEYGECEYTDESGFVTQAEQWHNHPQGTEYTEVMTP